MEIAISSQRFFRSHQESIVFFLDDGSHSKQGNGKPLPAPKPAPTTKPQKGPKGKEKATKNRPDEIQLHWKYAFV